MILEKSLVSLFIFSFLVTIRLTFVEFLQPAPEIILSRIHLRDVSFVGTPSTTISFNFVLNQ